MSINQFYNRKKLQKVQSHIYKNLPNPLQLTIYSMSGTDGSSSKKMPINFNIRGGVAMTNEQ